jgi:uncharacterized membrane protein YoaK (UPF0700 family)
MMTAELSDRHVDHAAVHATPKLVAVRDRLLVALAFSAGIYDAICFLSFGKVFTGFQTGNVVFLGLGLAGVRPPAGPNVVSVITSLAAFMAGAAVAMWLLRRFDGDEEVEDENVSTVWPPGVSRTLVAVLFAQAGFLVVWMATSPSTAVTYVLVGLNAFGMGLQMNAIRALHVPAVSTTAASATLISLTSGLASWSLKGHAGRRLAGVLVSMVAGALAGAWLLGHAHFYAPVLPVLVIAAVIAIASATLKKTRRRADSEER